MQGFISGILDSTSAGVGNLISEGNKEKIYATYKELFAVRFLVAGVLTACVYHLCNPFISVWLGSEYPLSSLILLLISIQFFLAMFRGTTDQFLFGYGLFYDVWAAATEAIIFIATAMIGGSIWGLSGVLCGPLVSTIAIIYLWKPYFLFSRGFEKSVFRYFKLFAIHLIGILAAFLGAEWLSDKVYSPTILGETWMNWILGSLLFTALMTVFSVVLLYVLSPGLRSFIHRFIKK